ncbi:MAG: PAS-domain containing protein, partial [Noviherbaspirillum sp.]
LLEFPARLMQVGTPFEAFMRYNAERGEYGSGDVEQLVAERMHAARLFQPHYAERVRPSGQIIAIRGEPLPHRGFVTLYTDISAQREAERLIRERNADLEQRVLERTTELERAYQRLHAINQTNEQIAGELRRSEQGLRLITDAIPALIAYIDKDEIYRFANRGYVEWFRRTKDDFVGRKVAEVLGPSMYADVAPYIHRALDGERVSYEVRRPVTTEQGTTEDRSASTELVPEVAPQGEVLGIFVLATDITEQKRTQATLVHAQKMEAVGQLAGGIAHDLNNMLTVVLGNLSALQERTRGSSDAQELVEPALLATRRGAALIKRLLTFSQQQPLEPRAVDVAELIAGFRTLLRRTLPENIELSLHFGERLAPALTDPHQLESALLNLSLNARDAMSAGGTLSLSTDMQSVSSSNAATLGLQPGNYVCITVADSGHGMDRQTLLRAGDPFFTTKRFGSGSGLGLPMVYGFARQSGGALRLQSIQGEGTVVSLFLPATDTLPLPAEQSASAATLSVASPLVLLVEDDAEVRLVVRRQLLELGYAVVEAADGREALDLLDQIREIRILVSDVVMPGGLDGPALARKVRAARPDIGILLISGYDRGSDGVGEFRLLDKPFTKSGLAAALAEAGA